MLPALVLAALSLGGGAALAHFGGTAEDGTGSRAAAAPTDAPSASRPTPKVTRTRPTVRPDAKPKPERTSRPARKPVPKATRGPAATPAPGPTPRKTAPGPGRTAVPRSGAGTFTTAQVTGKAVGTSGVLRRYRVQVEDGIDLSARGAAAEIERILAHPRGWAAHGRGRFQLVAKDADFVIRIATPDTADALCLRQGLHTRGELNCETSEGVVVNLRRWMLGSPTFAGKPAEYRHLIINHEVGHEIGLRNHLGCPGPGRPAPAMMQQIKGLHGCRSNAFPYDEEGRYITGPIVS